MRHDEAAVAVQRVDDVRVDFLRRGFLDAGADAREVGFRWRGEQHGGAEGVVEPVGAGQGDGGRGREEEELVEGMQEGCVGVEAEHAPVAGLVEGEEFREACRPGCVGGGGGE